jgi:hypothetical protein
MSRKSRTLGPSQDILLCKTLLYKPTLKIQWCFKTVSKSILYFFIGAIQTYKEKETREANCQKFPFQDWRNGWKINLTTKTSCSWRLVITRVNPFVSVAISLVCHYQKFPATEFSVIIIADIYSEEHCPFYISNGSRKSPKIATTLVHIEKKKPPSHHHPHCHIHSSTGCRPASSSWGLKECLCSYITEKIWYKPFQQFQKLIT